MNKTPARGTCADDHQRFAARHSRFQRFADSIFCFGVVLYCWRAGAPGGVARRLWDGRPPTPRLDRPPTPLLYLRGAKISMTQNPEGRLVTADVPIAMRSRLFEKLLCL